MMRLMLPLLVLPVTLAVFGCGDDGGTPVGDSGTGGDTSIGTDSGTPPGDTGTPPGDSGTPPSDTSTPPGDTGTPPGDTGTPPSDGGGSGDVGSACGGDGDCNMGLTCLMMVGGGGFGIEFPGGYCTREGCSGMGADPCPTGSACYSVGFGMFGTSYCARSCAGDMDCRMGYECGMPTIGMVSGDVCTPTFGTGFGDGGFGTGDGGFPFP